MNISVLKNDHHRYAFEYKIIIIYIYHRQVQFVMQLVIFIGRILSLDTRIKTMSLSLYVSNLQDSKNIFIYEL